MAPRADLLHPLAQEWLEEMPWQLRGDPDIQAVVHCYMREEERKRETLDTIRAQFTPQSATELGLPWWERLLKMTIAPAGYTVEQRRDAAVAALQRLRSRPRGLDQEAAISRLVGPGWTYQEHDPADVLSPAPGHVRFTLPVAPDAELYARFRTLIRGVIEAHVAVETLFEGGFVLDQDAWDEGLWA